MLDHLSHALHSFPVFLLVGFHRKFLRPTAVEDVVRVIEASLVEGRLSRKTVPVLGPEQIALDEAVKRVAHVVGRSPFYLRSPIWIHKMLAWIFEVSMTVPLASQAQVRILSEGIVEPAGPFDELPADLLPKKNFSEEQIRQGLPEPKGFGVPDCRFFSSWGKR